MSPFAMVGLICAGILLTQLAWVMALPPFAAIDEFEHAHRAAGVASGQWRLTEPAEAGRGLLVWVPHELVEAAHGRCSFRNDSDHGNCQPTEVTSDGKALIGTAAGYYNPLFYAYVGVAGLLADGAASLYVMRLASLLLCLACLAAGLVALRMWHSGPWALFCVLAALSPTLLYSTTVAAAPNGLEMTAALAVWLSLLGLRGEATTAGVDTRLLMIAAVATPLLIVPRTLGPLFFAAIAFTVVMWLGPTAKRIARARWQSLLALLGVAVASTAINVGWVLRAGGYAGDPNFGGSSDISEAFQVHRWTLQLVAVFPYRTEEAALWVYPMVLLVITSVIVVALRRGNGWKRLGLLTGLLFMYVGPISLCLITLADRGGEYQGRYFLPYVVGVLPMAGVILDRVNFAPLEGARLRLIGVILLACAHASSVAGVLIKELRRPLVEPDRDWLNGPAWFVIVLVLCGWVCHLLALKRAKSA